MGNKKLVINGEEWLEPEEYYASHPEKPSSLIVNGEEWVDVWAEDERPPSSLIVNGEEWVNVWSVNETIPTRGLVVNNFSTGFIGGGQ